MSVGKLLIDDQPLQVLPELAKAIGLNEAIFVQQLHYFLNISKHKYEDRIWIYNTIDEWCEIFPFWSKKTIQRTIKRLEEMGLILSTNKLNKMKMDKTKWYSIAYEKIEELTSQNDQMRCDQNGSSMRSKWDDRYSQNDQMRCDQNGSSMRSKWDDRYSQNDQMSCGQNDHTNNQRKDFYTEENTPLPPKVENSNDLENAFDVFWKVYKAKLNKSGALKSFKSAYKKYSQKTQKSAPQEFAEMLVCDVQKRLSLGQFGFDKLHPTTYLNNARWEDEYTQPAQFKGGQSVSDGYQDDGSWAVNSVIIQDSDGKVRVVDRDCEVVL
ncbi:TPA: hypothetical protein ACPDS2_002240 [Pasteurella multocida]|uniref:hypothetical protein n=1 Tax=Pasteurella multocida TaxID=747 RepID=UPI0009C255F2|nr:hypothetical protein [Pasteurella multocida]ARA88425.1 hypothetical protein BTV66_01810 [Pasteurella multocida subsp. septica]UZT18685.1 hypothetical protein ORI84_00405 [Pasteurella multocida]UZU34736.1 hypothetical protein ORU17_00405 [Pasteurella multocida]UZU39288.1 hypothetical protein ORU25_00405 [Pasteurella multocida]UZU41727.1 hypothetical protein ORU26_00405 [Pasteurella multocida]